MSSDSAQGSGVFVSHNSQDKPAVEALLQALGNRLDCWLDRHHLTEDAPLEVWAPKIRDAVQRYPVALVCLGPHGFGPIHQIEADAFAMARRTVVPVVLPGGRVEDLPLIQRAFTHIDLTAGIRPGPWLDALVELAGGLDERRMPPGLESPYRGLRTFGPEHRDLFFGRAADVARLVDRVGEAVASGQRFLVLTGPSGAGKSSVVQAGLGPALARHHSPKGAAGSGSAGTAPLPPPEAPEKPSSDQGVWRTLTLRIGERPALEVLAEALGQPLEADDALTQALAGPLRLGRTRIGEDASLQDPLLLVIDQAEELFTGERTPERARQRDRFFAQLLDAAHHPDSLCTVLLTIRADHLGLLHDHSEALKAAATAGEIRLTDMRQDALRLAIEGPARLAGRRFEPGTREQPGPVAELIRALDEQPGHLPLLEFALDQWWRASPEGDLSRATYDHIGRLEGAITRHADEVLARFGPRRIEALYLLEDLVHPGEGTSDTRRPRLRAELEPALAELIDPLVNARLLTAGDHQRIELAHDSLVRHWPTLTKHINEVRARLAADRPNEDLARAWEQGGRRSDDLLRGPRLKLLDERVKQPGRAPSQILRRFHGASAKARTRRRWSWGIGSTVVLATLGVFGGVAFVQNREAAAQGRIAADRLEKGIEVAARIGQRVQNELTSSRDVPTLRKKLLDDMAELLRTLDPMAGHSKVQREEAVRLAIAGDGLKEAGDLAGARTQYEAALVISKRLAEVDPSNTGWQRDLYICHDRLGDLAVATGDLAGARTQYEASLAIAQRLAAAEPSNLEWQRGLSISHERLGDLAKATGDLTGARTQYEASLAIAQRLAAAEPSNLEWQRDLSVSHSKLGDLAQATGDLAGVRTQYAAALAFARLLAAAEPSNLEWQRGLSVSHIKLGDLAKATGDLAGARTQDEESLAIAQRLAAADPSNTEWQRDLSISHERLGDLAKATGDMAGARAHYETRLAIMKRLTAAEPSNAQWQRDLSVSHERLGELAVAMGDLAGAHMQYEASLASRQRLVAADSSNTEWQRNLSVSHERLGDLAVAKGDLAGASTQYEAAQVIHQRLTAEDPHNAEWQRDLSVGHIKLGDVARANGDLAGALTQYAATRAIAQRLAAADPSNTEWQRDLVASLQRLVIIEAQAGRFPEARGHIQAGLALLEHLLTGVEGGDLVKVACQFRIRAAGIEAQAADAAAAAVHRAEAKRLLALLDARGEYQGDTQLDGIRAMLKNAP